MTTPGGLIPWPGCCGTDTMLTPELRMGGAVGIPGGTIGWSVETKEGGVKHGCFFFLTKDSKLKNNVPGCNWSYVKGLYRIFIEFCLTAMLKCNPSQ